MIILARTVSIVAAVYLAAVPAHALVIEDSTFTTKLTLTGHALDGIIIRNCTFVGAAASLEVKTITGGRIEDCTFLNNAGSGVQIGVGAIGWTVRNCSFTNIGRNGVLVQQDAINLVIEECEFTDVATDSVGDKRHGIYAQAPGVLIQNNTFSRIHDGNAISIRSTGTVRGNVVGDVGLLGQQSDGIKYYPSSLADPTATLVIENNIVWDPSKHGIELDALPADSLNYAENVVIRYNTVLIRSGPHVLHPSPRGIDLDADMADKYMSVYGNLVVNEVRGLSDNSDSPPHADFAQDNLVFAANPGFFVDWAAENFHILNNPLVVDAAQPSPAPPGADLDGDPRPTGNAPDVGADELGVITNLRFAIADTYVRGGAAANTNFNGTGLLRAKGAAGDDDDQRAFLKFDLNGVPHPVISGTLYLFLEALTNGGPAAAHLYSVGNDSWNEATLQWNTQPAAGSLLDQRLDLSAAGIYYDFDVTSFADSTAAGDHVLSIMLRDDLELQRASDFDQREDSHPPLLLLQSFPTPQVNLTTNITGQGEVVTSPAGPAFIVGTNVVLTAVASPNWKFSQWGGAVSGSGNPANLMMSADATIAAGFVPLDAGGFRQFLLSVPPVASAENNGNAATLAVDNLLATRWEALGDGQWIRVDLGATESISAVSIAWHEGDQRLYSFDVQVSNDAQSWSPSFAAAANSGQTSQPEIYDLVDVVARYVRIVGHGNDIDASTAITELAVLRQEDPTTDAENPGAPRRARLWPNYPNPFNPATTFRYELAEAEHVRLDVYDVAGRLVTTLVNAKQKPGSYALGWNGTDRDGRRVASGTYYARLKLRAGTHAIKLTLLQ